MAKQDIEIKITIAKLIELSYREDKGMTAKIVLEKGPFKMTVDQNGRAVLTGKAGVVYFSGSEALEKFGFKYKMINVSFSHAENDNVEYTVSFTHLLTSFTVKGEFNPKELILECSGLLCQAARALKGGPARIEADLKLLEAMDR